MEGMERPAGSSPHSRWSQLRLVLTRNSNGTAEVTLVHRQTGGGDRWDRRLGWTRISCPPGSPVSTDALTALASALEALRRGLDER